MNVRRIELWAAVSVVVLSLASSLVLAQGEPSCIISGKVVWPEHDLTTATIQLFRDAGLSDRALSTHTFGPAGSYFTACQPGTYYLMALVDLNADGQPGAGDGLGFYGVTDANDASQKPAPLTVGAGKGLDRVDIHVVSVISAAGKPQPIPTEQLAREVREPRPISDTGSFFAGVAGKLVGLPEGKVAPAWAFAAATPTFDEVLRVAPVDPQTGIFRLEVQAETVFVACIVDVNEDSTFDTGDLVGVFGIAQQGDATPAALPVGTEGETRTEITPDATVNEHGDVALPDGRVITGLRPGQFPPVLAGTLTGPPCSRVVLRLFSDARFRLLVGAVAVPPDRPFTIAAPDVVGVYIVALFDADDNGQTTAGDAIGFYGVSDLTSSGRPKPLLLAPGTVIKDVNIAASARMGEDGKLKALPPP